ncbi:MAG: hypothetical protein AAB300_01350 [Nitrospirota bacterium]
MIEVGLWIRTASEGAPQEPPLPSSEEIFLIKKDQAGHPVFSTLKSVADVPSEAVLDTVEAKKAKIRSLYQSLTGHPHPHPHATSRQLMWDFIEAAMKQLA